MADLLTILTAVLIISLISLIGVLVLLIKRTLLSKITLILVAFSSGSMLSAAFFHLIPASTEIIGEASLSFVLAGIVSFFIIESFLHWHHHHHPDVHVHDEKSGPKKPFTYTYMNLVGDGIHNFIDGAIIAASFLADPLIGLSTALAIAAHEVPQEIGDFAILIHGRMSKGKALLYNFLSALIAIIGAMLTYYYAQAVEGTLPLMLAFGGGSFIYIATTDIMPEIHKHKKNLSNTISYMIVLLSGIALIYYLGMLFPE